MNHIFFAKAWRSLLGTLYSNRDVGPRKKRMPNKTVTLQFITDEAIEA